MKEISVDITQEMKDSYLDYAMSVIVSRALPDVRDGLKPVHRRILYAMKQLALWPNKPFKKSATIVGEVLGKFHPHGDAAVYDSLVRMAQDFSLRYPLVWGHGNFGSIDGDPAAAYRYTEAKLSKIATLMLEDIDKDTVDFQDNFDNTQKEPVVLPARLPNLLLNGSSGIAVGMATNIPPHNLEELINAIVYFIKNKDCTVDDLIHIIKGPDFPTGGRILGTKGIFQMYKTGKGAIPVYSKYHIEKIGRKKAIIIDEIPYMVNKTKLIEDIASLVDRKEIVGITDIRDESDRDGIRIVLVLRNDKSPDIIVNQLIKRSNFKVNFNAIMLVLVNGVPKILNLKQLIYYFYKHRFEVITRRTKHDLDKAKARLHLIEGFLIAILNIDEVIQIIKSSKDSPEASLRLQNRFSLTQLQAQGILDMRLHRLTGLEKLKLEQEAQELKEQIKYFQELLADANKVDDLIIDELEEVKEKFADKRKTVIESSEYKEIDVEDLIHREKIVVMITYHGYIKRLPLNVYKSQHRGTKGLTGLSLKDNDFVQDIFIMDNLDDLLLFSDKGRVYRIKGYQIPQSSRNAKGTSIVNLFNIDKSERITTLFPVSEYRDDLFLFTASKYGYVNRIALSYFSNINIRGLKAVKLDGGDILKSVEITDGKRDILLTTKNGYVNRFKEQQITSHSRGTRGVKGINLRQNDELIKGHAIYREDADLLLISQKGIGKRVKIEEFPLHSRGTKGVIGLKVSEKTGLIADSLLVIETDQVMVSTKTAKILRVKVSEIAKYSRTAMGVKIIVLNEDDRVKALARLRL